MYSTYHRIIRIINDYYGLNLLNISSTSPGFLPFPYIHTWRSEQETLCVPRASFSVKLCCGDVFKMMQWCFSRVCLCILFQVKNTPLASESFWTDLLSCFESGCVHMCLLVSFGHSCPFLNAFACIYIQTSIILGEANDKSLHKLRTLTVQFIWITASHDQKIKGPSW